MQSKQLYAAAFVLSIMSTSKIEGQPLTWPQATPPVAAAKPKNVGLHGDERMDNYYWMGDCFFKGPDSTKVVDYLNDENAYLKTMMASTESFQDKLFKEMKGRIKKK